MLLILLTSSARWDIMSYSKHARVLLLLMALQFMQAIFYFQAFNLTANATESLDNMLTDSLKSRMPATGLQLFGVRQIEEDNMAACEY